MFVALFLLEFVSIVQQELISAGLYSSSALQYSNYSFLLKMECHVDGEIKYQFKIFISNK